MIDPRLSTSAIRRPRRRSTRSAGTARHATRSRSRSGTTWGSRTRTGWISTSSSRSRWRRPRRVQVRRPRDRRRLLRGRWPPAGRDNGPPGIRAHYHEHYYGAFVHDADGNNIGAVCQSRCRRRLTSIVAWEPLSDDQLEIRDSMRTLARERVPRARRRSTRRTSSRGTSSSSSGARGSSGSSSTRHAAARARGRSSRSLRSRRFRRSARRADSSSPCRRLSNSASRSRGRTSRRSVTCRGLRVGVARRVCADRGRLRLGLLHVTDDRTPRRRPSTSSTARSASSPTPRSRPSTRSSLRPIRGPDRGISAFVVESNTWLRRRSSGAQIGIAGSTTGELVFEGARIEAVSRLGEEATASGSRCGSSTALDRGSPRRGSESPRVRRTTRSKYARTRDHGKPIADHQLIAGKLADMETRCEAARAHLLGRMVDEGAPDAELTGASAMARLFCTDTAMEVTTEAVQILGRVRLHQRIPGGAHDARRGSRRSTRGRTRSTPGDRARDAQGISRVPPHRRRVAGSRAVLAAPAVDELVEAALDELPERPRPPCVEKVGVPLSCPRMRARTRCPRGSDTNSTVTAGTATG